MTILADCKGCLYKVKDECRRFPLVLLKSAKEEHETEEWGFPPALHRCGEFVDENKSLADSLRKFKSNT
jgi:hypothetical protein